MSKRYKQKSIRYQFALTFSALLSCTILSCIIINSLFLKPYYQHTRQARVVSAYYTINEWIKNQGLEPQSDEFANKFYQLCDGNNLNIVMIDSSFNIVVSNSREDRGNIQRLLSYIFKENPNFIIEKENEGDTDETENNSSDEKHKMFNDRIVETNNDYSVHVSMDPVMGADYIELWGTLDDGHMILIRTAVQSIREGANISNRFLIFVGILAILVGGIIVWFVTKQVTEPILKLTQISKRMANLDFDVKYEGESINEIGVLGENFNAMSDSLKTAIGDLKNANNELKTDLEKREQIDQMRKEFLSNVSHELKTPIALIQGYAEGLKDGISDDPENAEFYCDVIIDEASKMNSLVKKLLTLNQLEFGFDSIDMTRFDIVEMINNYLKSIEIISDGIEIVFDNKAINELYVWADEFKTEEVLSNYLSNAINHVDLNKKIVVTLNKYDECVRISVFNSGLPIPNESIDKIWNKFYKVDKARTREYGGSGVGLSIVKAIMDNMHQKYGVINHEDGVEFYFELDCKQK